MKVKFFAYVRNKEYAGCKETIVQGCADLRQLGIRLSEMYGETIRTFYFSPDGTTFGEQAIVLVNGRRAEFLDGLDTRLNEEDTVLLFPVVAGG